MDHTADQSRLIERVLSRINAEAEGGVLFVDDAKKQRKDIHAMFRYLAKHGRLPVRSRVPLLRKVVEQDCTLRPRVTVQDGRATFTTEAECKSAYAEAAFVLLWLSQESGGTMRIGACRQCERLFVRPKGRGRHRLFCSSERCGNARRQREWRERQKAAKVAKTKKPRKGGARDRQARTV
jgi:predicted RNA-binding Zn ribbon-like protein